MIDGPLVLWTHALAALLFGVIALDQLRRPSGGWPHAAFVAALLATALWALAIAGIEGGDPVARIAESIRNIAWLGFMYALVRRDRAGHAALTSVYAVVIAIAGISAILSVIETLPAGPAATAAFNSARLVLRMMAAVSALILLHHLGGAARAGSRARVRLVTAALAGMWGVDLVFFSAAYLAGAIVPALVVLRGAVMVGLALVLAIVARQRGDWTFALSRTVAVRSLSAVALVIYAGLTMMLTTLADDFAGVHARVVQTAIVFGATAALMTLLSTPWLRAWTRVKVAKHLFRHRYDYRVEWQRFTDTLGRPGEGAAPLDTRIVKAIADLTDSPAGLLLVPDGAVLGTGAAWNWDLAGSVDEPLATYLAASGRIVELDPVRNGRAPEPEAAQVPGWICDRPDTWAIVPLIHGGLLVGAILLARPPIDRALDWEDFDLLRVAGRQAASYLAEDRAHDALADAQRFDEFNRRFAFILHDIKNLVSQLTLVARNAERHADNPDFRADMVATLKDSSDRMNALLARLSQHHAAPAEVLQPVDAAALIARVAGIHRAQHPIACRIDAASLALAHPTRLEQVLGHLVQNAIEASAPDQPILLSVGMAGDRVVIGVGDHGCGMTPGFVRDQLFRPFVSSKPGGFGIGAFEARQLVQEMGGTLEVVSREGEGTQFRILLPAAVTLEAAA